MEKIIDRQLNKQNLAITHKLFEAMKPAVSNRVDAVLGYILGWVYADTFNLFTSILKREPKQEEINEVGNAISKRLLEIKGRINETFT